MTQLNKFSGIMGTWIIYFLGNSSDGMETILVCTFFS